MSDFLDDVGRQLVERARQELQPAPRARWSRRTLALTALALLAVAVPAAAVTGVFEHKAQRHLPAAPGLVDVTGGCAQKNPPRGRLTDKPPPAALLSLLAVLRRPQRPSDRLPDSRLALQPMDGVNPDYVRQVTSSSGMTAYLIPAWNTHFMAAALGCDSAPAPDPPLIEPAAGVCLRLKRGESCATIDGIRSGRNLLTSGGSGHGTTLAAGVVPDGVTAVIWRVRRGTGFLDTRIPVRDNVYIGHFPGRKGHGLYVFFVGPGGRKRQVIGPAKLTPAQRREHARERALDRAAGPAPTIYPDVGGGHTLFELRMRIPDPKPGDLYVVTVTGPLPGACSKTWVQTIGMQPGGRRDQRGLMRAGFGRPGLESPLCPGTYRGVVTKGRGKSAPRAGSFSFRVR